jgi:peroxiredoxin
MEIASISMLPSVEGVDTKQERRDLYTLFKPGRYALVWWHPQVLSPSSCKTCGGYAEPIKLLREIHQTGCEVIGLTYESPDAMADYLNAIGVVYPVLSVGKNEARQHGVAKAQGEPWGSIPHRVAFLVDEHGQIINRYEVSDATMFLRTVRDDVKSGPPSSKWTPVKKRKKFLGIL